MTDPAPTQVEPNTTEASAPATAVAQPKKAAPAGGNPKGGANNNNNGGGKNKKKRMILKTPKGTRDYDPTQMAIRELVLSKIIRCFKSYGAVTIETPLFELKETLTNKYGEDSKLIYDLEDQGGEICSLRYDLTVPFARHLAMNRIPAMKRYHIGRVYRRDQPSAQQGRWREFYQCDFDIAGKMLEPMLPDAETLSVLVDILNSLDLGNFVVKVNSRKLLDGIFAICNVPDDKFRAICSSVDKLDKLSWEEVKKEMLTKGLDAESADKIYEFVQLNGRPLELLEQIKTREICKGNKAAEQGLSDLSLLFSFLAAFNCLDKISFDLSLARGLDYYTGIIFEAVMLDKGGLGVGSIAGGGRYDNLVEQFGGGDIPCIGFSVGVERVFAILEAKQKKDKIATKIRPSATEVLVCTISNAKNADALLSQRIKIVAECRKAGIPAELLQKKNPKIDAQLKYAYDMGIPLAVIFGEDEIAKGEVKIKNLETKTEETVSIDSVVSVLQTRVKLI